MELRDRIAIVGIGETEYLRRSRKDIKTLLLEAVEAALDDARISPREVDGIITEVSTMPRLFPHDELAYHLGISRRYSATVANVPPPAHACSPLTAAMAIESGLADVVLYYFGVNWGSCPGGAYAFHELYPDKLSFEVPYGYWGQPPYFSAVARRYMDEYGLTSKQLGSIAVTQRRHALLNGRAQMRKPLTYEDYERSPLVVDPLRVLDCCLITDGAAAFVMCSAERAKDHPHPPVYVMGAGFASLPMGASA
ncbi:MAG: thiolase family protein [Dehalococcoidia bacterium]